jgi:ribosome-binding factor A
MKEGRARRVGEAVREEVAGLLTKGIKDPRIGFVSVMEVKMSPDLRYADVYVSLYGTDKEKKSSLAGLRSSAGFIRREVTRRLKLRFAPEIRFHEDTTLDQAFHLEEIFREMNADGTPNETAGPSEGGGRDEESDERD